MAICNRDVTSCLLPSLSPPLWIFSPVTITSDNQARSSGLSYIHYTTTSGVISHIGKYCVQLIRLVVGEQRGKVCKCPRATVCAQLSVCTYPGGRVRGGSNGERAGLQRGHGRGLLELLGVLHHPQGVAGTLHRGGGSVGCSWVEELEGSETRGWIDQMKNWWFRLRYSSLRKRKLTWWIWLFDGLRESAWRDSFLRHCLRDAAGKLVGRLLILHGFSTRMDESFPDSGWKWKGE